jgi:hypothetical protein
VVGGRTLYIGFEMGSNGFHLALNWVWIGFIWVYLALFFTATIATLTL